MQGIRHATVTFSDHVITMSRGNAFQLVTPNDATNDLNSAAKCVASIPGATNVGVNAPNEDEHDSSLGTKPMSSVRRIMKRTIGLQLEHASDGNALQSFMDAIDSYCETLTSLASIGKSLYASSAVVFVLDASMRVILWNDAAEKVTGYGREQIAGCNITQDMHFMISFDTAKALTESMNTCQQQRVPVTGLALDFRCREGTCVQILSTCAPLLANPIGGGMLVSGIEVTKPYEAPIKSNDSVHTSNVMRLPKVPTATIFAPPPPVPTQNVFSAATTQFPASVPNLPPPALTSNALKVPGWAEIAPNYSIECVLGQGSYGQVVRCKHLPTGEVVAIKKIQNVFSDPIDAKRILRELCILRQLRHPNIVQIREIIAPADFIAFQDLFVVFEYLPSDLEKLLHSPQFLSAEHLRWLLLDLLKALKYMHSAEIIHRDLKPANILLNLSPVAIKICDFGLARGFSSKQSSAAVAKKRKCVEDSDDDRGVFEGAGVHPRTPARRIERQLTEHVVTRWYRAPEIIFRAHDYSAAIDVWSIGCIFAELLSMQKSSVPSHYHREPLFPGVSCFPLSPGAGQTALPQDSRDQLNTILNVFGTMEEEDIAEIANAEVQAYLRGLPPRPRKNLQEMYPGAEPAAIELLTWMLQMNPRKRATLDEALSHKYLASIRSLEEEIIAPGTIQLDFDEKKLTVAEIRIRMVQEIKYHHPSVVIPPSLLPCKLNVSKQFKKQVK